MAVADAADFDALLWAVLMESYENEYWLTRAERDYCRGVRGARPRILDTDERLADSSVFSALAVDVFWEPAITALHNTVDVMERGAAAGDRPAISGLLHMRDSVAPAMYYMYAARHTASSRDILVNLLLHYATAFWRRIVITCMVEYAADILGARWDYIEMQRAPRMLAALHEIGAAGIAGHPECERDAAAEVAEQRVPANSDLGISILNMLGVPLVPRSVFDGGRWGPVPRSLVATRGRVPSSSWFHHQRSPWWHRDVRARFGRRYQHAPLGD